MWNLLEQYPGLAGVVVSVPWAHQLFAGPFAQAHQSLVERGLDPEEAGVVLDFVGDTVITMHAQIEVMRSPIDQAAPSPGAAGERGGTTRSARRIGQTARRGWRRRVVSPPLAPAPCPRS